MPLSLDDDLKQPLFLLLGFCGVILGLLLVLQFVVVFLQFIALLRAKRKVWPYLSESEFTPETESDSKNPYEAPGSGDLVGNSDYSFAIREQAEQHGFRHVGRYYDGNIKSHSVCYDLHVAPNGKVLSVVASGRLGLITVDCTFLLTRLTDFRNLVTLDENKFADGDCSARSRYVVLANADFPELLECHRKRVDAAGNEVIPYPLTDTIATYRQYSVEGVDWMVKHGWAKYVDADHSIYKATVRGAFLTAVLGTLRKIFRGIGANNRAHFRKPGRRGYVPSGQPGRARSLWLERLRFLCLIVMFVGIFWSFTGMNTSAFDVVVMARLVPLFGLTGAIMTSALLWLRR